MAGMRKGVSFIVATAGAAFAVLSSAQAASLPRPAIVVSRGEVPFAKVVRSAELGSARYQAVLGYMYEAGRGVPQDYHLAAFWYRQAAEQGNVRAQHLLGLLYDRGQGVPLDYVEAHKWLNLAAARASSGDRDYFVRIRNAVASKLTRHQIYDAQRRARVWALGRDG